jgi:hypothetical protein
MNKDANKDAKDYWKQGKSKLKRQWASFVKNDLPKIKDFCENLKEECQKKYKEYKNKKENPGKKLDKSKKSAKVSTKVRKD